MRVNSRRFHRFPLNFLIALLFVISAAKHSVCTMFSSSIQACQEQCSQRNIAIPLPSMNLTWEYLSASSGDCDYACHLESCHVGCRNLVNSNDCYSAKPSKCHDVKSPEACRQGCRAAIGLFLHHLQGLLNRVTIDAGIQYDGLQHSVRVNFSFDESQSPSLQELASTDLMWVAMSRSHGLDDDIFTSPPAWKWNGLGAKAFRNSSISPVGIHVPLGDSPEVQFRLAARWRGAVVASTTFSHTLSVPVNDAAHALPPPRPRSISWGRLQLSLNSYVVCWRPDPFYAASAKPVLYRLRLFSVPNTHVDVDASVFNIGFNTLLSTYYTSAQCHLLRDLPTRADQREFRLVVKQIGSHESLSADALGTGTSTFTTNTSTTSPLLITADGSSMDSSLNSMTGGEANTTLVISTELPTHANSTSFDYFDPVQFTSTTTSDSANFALSTTTTSNTTLGLEEETASSTELFVNIHLEKVEVENEGKTTGDGDVPPLLLLTNGSHLLLMRDTNDFVVTHDPDALPMPIILAADNATITALTALSRHEVMIGLSNGSILRLDISSGIDGNVTQPLKQFSLVTVREGDGVAAITQIAIDHMQGKIYAVRNRSGLVRCQSLSTCDTFTLMNSTSPFNYILSIAVDSWNGYLYYVTNSGDTFSTPLFPIDAPLNYNMPIARRLVELAAVFTLEMDVSGQRLIALLQNGSLFSRDLVDERLKNEREGVKMSDAYRAVVKAQYAKGSLFWTSTSCGDSHPWSACLYGEETDPKNSNNHRSFHLNKSQSGEIRDFTMMRDFVAPAFIVPPSKFGITIASQKARLSWRPPNSLHYQAPGSSWRQYVYEVNVTACNLSPGGAGAKNVSTIARFSAPLDDWIISLPEIIYSNGSNYTALVASLRVCSSALQHICSTWVHASSVLYASDSILPRTAFLLYGQTRGVTSKDQIQPATSEQHRNRVSATAVADTLGSEVSPEQMRYLPDLSPLLADSPSLFAIDNSTGTIYTAYNSDASSKLYRLVLDDGGLARTTFIQWESIRYLAVSSKHAIIFVASSFSITSYRLTSSFEAIVHECDEENCSEVIGLAVDEESRSILYLLQQPSGAVQLLSCDYFSQDPTVISSSQRFPVPLPLKQMIKMGERFLFITHDGQVGTFDKAINNINFNYALKDIAFAVGVDAEPPTIHKIHFLSPIEFDTSKAELSWNIEPSSPGLQCIYKVHLYRSGSSPVGGHHTTTHLALTNRFSIPSRVLEGWSSQQKFDVRVEAMNAWGSASTSRRAIVAPSKPPSVPRNVGGLALSPETVLLYWDLPEPLNAPADEIKYRVSQLNSTIAPRSATPFSDITTTVEFVSCNQSPCEVKVRSLRPYTAYKFWITAVHVSRVDIASVAEETESTSKVVALETKDAPGSLRLLNLTHTTAVLQWTSTVLANNLPSTVTIQYRQSGVDRAWVDSSTFMPSAGSIIDISITNLYAGVGYDIRYAADYICNFNGSVSRQATERYSHASQQVTTKDVLRDFDSIVAHHLNSEVDEGDYEVNLLEMAAPPMPPLDAPSFMCRFALGWLDEESPQATLEKIAEDFDRFCEDMPDLKTLVVVWWRSFSRLNTEGPEEFLREHCSDILRY